MAGNSASSIASLNLEFCWRKGGITIEMERGCSRKPSRAPITPGASGNDLALVQRGEEDETNELSQTICDF